MRRPERLRVDESTVGWCEDTAGAAFPIAIFQQDGADLATLLVRAPGLRAAPAPPNAARAWTVLLPDRCRAAPAPGNAAPVPAGQLVWAARRLGAPLAGPPPGLCRAAWWELDDGRLVVALVDRGAAAAWVLPDARDAQPLYAPGARVTLAVIRARGGPAEVALAAPE